MSRYETKLIKDTLCADTKVDFSGPQALSILKYNPQGTLQWGKNLCGQRIYSEAFTPSSSGGVFVSLFVQGAKGFCFDTAAEGVLVSLSSLGEVSWCRSLGAGQPAPLTLNVTDGSGNVYVLGSETALVNGQISFLASVFSFDPSGNFRWQGGVGGLQTTLGPRFLGSLDGIDSSGELLLTDPEGRIVRMGSSGGQIHSSYQPLYQECGINMNADSGTARFIGLNNRIFAYGILGDGVNDYHYLAECDTIGQVKNIRRWTRPGLGASSSGVVLSVIRANHSDSVFIAGASPLAGSPSGSYFPFLQKLNPDLSN